MRNLSTTNVNTTKTSYKSIFKKIYNFFKSLSFPKLNYKSVIKFVFKIAKIYSGAISGAILLIVLGHFVPELRDIIPSLYIFAEWMLNGVEFIFDKILNNLNLV